mmetsp:Transcript_5597/g.16651  ORF Transcript_5597/g.16651 Transcript_5597/m.16651 type:complete len:564 (+) Transcript_5597:731-2422(+)
MRAGAHAGVPSSERVSAVVSVQTASRAPYGTFLKSPVAVSLVWATTLSSGAGANGKTLLASPNNFFRVSPSIKGAMASKSTAKAPWSSKKATSPASKEYLAFIVSSAFDATLDAATSVFISSNFRKAPSEAARLRWSSVVAHARSINAPSGVSASLASASAMSGDAHSNAANSASGNKEASRRDAATAFATAVDASPVFVRAVRSGDGDAASASVTDSRQASCKDEGGRQCRAPACSPDNTFCVAGASPTRPRHARAATSQAQPSPPTISEPRAQSAPRARQQRASTAAMRPQAASTRWRRSKAASDAVAASAAARTQETASKPHAAPVANCAAQLHAASVRATFSWATGPKTVDPCEIFFASASTAALGSVVGVGLTTLAQAATASLLTVPVSSARHAAVVASASCEAQCVTTARRQASGVIVVVVAPKLAAAVAGAAVVAPPKVTPFAAGAGAAAAGAAAAPARRRRSRPFWGLLLGPSPRRGGAPRRRPRPSCAPPSARARPGARRSACRRSRSGTASMAWPWAALALACPAAANWPENFPSPPHCHRRRAAPRRPPAVS